MFHGQFWDLVLTSSGVPTNVLDLHVRIKVNLGNECGYYSNIQLCAVCMYPFILRYVYRFGHLSTKITKIFKHYYSLKSSENGIV